MNFQTSRKYNIFFLIFLHFDRNRTDEKKYFKFSQKGYWIFKKNVLSLQSNYRGVEQW